MSFFDSLIRTLNNLRPSFCPDILYQGLISSSNLIVVSSQGNIGLLNRQQSDFLNKILRDLIDVNFVRFVWPNVLTLNLLLNNLFSVKSVAVRFVAYKLVLIDPQDDHHGYLVHCQKGCELLPVPM